MIPELEEKLGVSFPAPSEFSSDEFCKFLDSLCVKHDVECSHPRTVARMLDKVRSINICKVCLNTGKYTVGRQIH